MSPAQRNLNVSNAFSALRFVLAVPAGVAIMRGRNDVAILLGLLGCVTDVLDGYLARRLNQVTELGKMIDPLADKFFVGVVVLALVVRGVVAPWFVIAVLGRDALILACGMYVRSRRGIVMMSNYLGKAAVVALSITFIAVLATNAWTAQPLVFALVCLSTGLMLASLVAYGVALIRQLKKGSI